MALECPLGWELVSAPSKPDDLRRELSPDYSLTSRIPRKRTRHGKYEWFPGEGVVTQQGNCGEEHTFVGGLTIETSSAHTINIGVLFNVAGEAAELQGGYAYTWGGTASAGSGNETSPGPDECWEYLGIPIVLKFTVCIERTRTEIPIHTKVGHGLLTAVTYIIPGWETRPYSPPYSWTECERPLIMRGGLMICRRWCCDGDPPALGNHEGETAHEE